MKEEDQDILFASGSEHWATPREPLLSEIVAFYGKFTLDPCATARNTVADRYYTVQHDGLAQDWKATNVFVNPPFNKKKKMYVGPWVKKATEEVALHHTQQVVMLVPARTDTIWWHKYVMPMAENVWFIKGRVKFTKPNTESTSAPFPSAIIVFRLQSGMQVFGAWHDRYQDRDHDAQDGATDVVPDDGAEG